MDELDKVKEEHHIPPHRNKSLQGMKEEIWQEIPGFDGHLLISKLGRIKSLARYVERANGSKGYWTKDKILSQTVQKIKNHYTGDHTFHLFCKVGYNGKRFSLNIRRLVYKLFVDSTLDEKDKKYRVVSVKDGNGLKCDSTNVELINIAERINRSLREERTVLPAYKTSEKNRRKGIKKMARSRQLKIKQYTIDGKYKKTYSSIKKATKATGANGSHIIACAKGKRRQAGECVWRYEGHQYVVIN